MDTLEPQHRSWLMSRVRSKDTKPELFVRSLVRSMGFGYRLHSKELPGKPDLVFKSRKKVIFVHGCFWHMHETCPKARVPRSNSEFWLQKMKNNAARDAAAKASLTEKGWKYLEVWQCQLGHPEELRTKVLEFLAE